MTAALPARYATTVSRDRKEEKFSASNLPALLPSLLDLVQALLSSSLL